MHFKLIIAGSRSITDYDFIEEVCKKHVETLANTYGEVKIVSGMAEGVDYLAACWAEFYNYDVIPVPANWDDIEGKPDYMIGYTATGTPFYRHAGHERNILMADLADGLLAIWDGKSGGTKDMIDLMKRRNKAIKVVLYKEDK